MKIAVYARVSSQGDRQDTENQLQPLREWAQKMGGELVEEYVDKASGSKAQRDSLQRLLEEPTRGSSIRWLYGP